MHWTEEMACRVRAELELRTFVTTTDGDRILDYAIRQQVQVRFERDADCLGEIRRGRAGWRMKIAAGLDPDLWLDVFVHELAHRFTSSGMASACAGAFSWWWRARDERSAFLWAAHFRLPTDPLIHLLQKRPTWDDLLCECQAPEGLLALKLQLLGCRVDYQPDPPPECAPELPPLATLTLSPRLSPEPAWRAWQYWVGVVDRKSGQRWVMARAASRERLYAAYEEITWDLLAWSEARFWDRWKDRLEPDLEPGSLRWSNPKAGLIGGLDGSGQTFANRQAPS